MTEVERVLTRTEAVTLTNQINGALHTAWDLIVKAYHGRAWQALDYKSWDAYCAGEFGQVRLRMPSEEREERVKSLRAEGLSYRAIASATGYSKDTIQRDAENARVSNETPVTGLDGKTYPQDDDEIVDAEIVEEGEDDVAGAEVTKREAPNRRPLHLMFRKPVIDVSRATRRLADLMRDDRFGHNRNLIAKEYGPQLRMAHDELSALINAIDG